MKLTVRSLALACLAAMPLPAHAATKPPPLPPSKMPPLSPAIIDNALAIGGDDVAARVVKTRMTVEVRVNGQGPYRFVVDSGADSSVVGMRIADGLKLPAGAPAILNGVTESARVERVLVDEIAFGPSVVRNLELPKLFERNLGGDGMIGIDALVEQRLMLDFEARTIKVEDAKKPAPRMDGEIIVTARRRRGQLILTEVKAAGYAVEAVVDTGSQISIGNVALRDKLMRAHKDKFTKIAVTGVTGVTQDLLLARIGEIKIGSVTLKNVPIAFADVPPFRVFGLANQPSLLIGTDLLETFRRVSLDFKARKVRFQLKKCGTTGITLGTAPSMGITRLSSGDDDVVCRR